MQGFDTTEDAGHNLTAAGLYSLACRRRWLLLGSFVVLFGVSVALVLCLPRKYEAEAKLMLKRARTETPVDVEKGRSVMVSTDVTETEISSEIELFWNRSSLEETVRTCGLADELDSDIVDPLKRTTLAVRELEKQLSIGRIGKTNLISVTYSHLDSVRAAAVVQTLIDTYLAKHMAVHRNTDTAEFFNRQTSIHGQQLSEAQTALTEFRNRNQVSLLEAEKQGALRRFDDLGRILLDTESQIEDATDRITRLQSQIRQLPKTIETQSRSARNQPLLEKLKTGLLDLENKRTQLLTKYDSGYRLVREVDQQIQGTKRMLEQEQQASVVDWTHAPNPLRQSLEGDLLRTETTLAGQKAKRAKLVRDLERVRSGQSKLERLTGEYDDLVRQVKLAEDNYLLYQKRREESRLADAMDRQRILNVSVVEEVVPPAVPTEQFTAVLLILSAIMAAFGSLGLAFAADYAVPALRGAAQSEKAVQETFFSSAWKAAGQGAPGDEEFLHQQPAHIEERGPIPMPGVVQEESAFTARVRNEDPPPRDAGGIDPNTVSSSSSLPAVRQPVQIREMMSRDLALRDDYGHIIDYVGGLRGADQGMAIGLAPGIGAENAAVAAVQLAHSMHDRNGLPVLLVDAGHCQQSLAQLFGTPEGPGLNDLLQGRPDIENQCIHRTDFQGLWILPRGNRQLNGGVSPARADSMHKTLANRSLNLIVYLPSGEDGKPELVTYSILDAVLSDLKAEGAQGQDIAEIVRRVVEAKRSFAAQRLTLVGSVEQWNNGEKESLTVC